jgi:hypothetical protein
MIASLFWRRIPILVCLGLTSATGFAQSWLKTTPREAHDIHGTTGQWVAYPTIQLPVGMQYWIHSTGRIMTEGSTSNYADAHYYNGFLASGLAQVGLQVQYNATQFAFLQVQSAALPSGSHDYIDRIASAGTPLSFRFFDSQEYPGTKPYYADNSGLIHVEVAQATPELVVKADTLFFGDVDMRSPLVLYDSVESIGTDPFVVDRVQITGSPDFTINSAERGVASFQIGEQKTNSFGIQFAPTQLGNSQAVLHIISSSAFYSRDRDRTIVLIGIGHGPVIQAVIDTIHFGLVPINATRTKVGTFRNVGDRDGTITTIAFQAPSPFSSSDTKPIPAGATIDVSVDFHPTTGGYWLSRGDLVIDNGFRSVAFYADGFAATGESTVTPDTLFFGGVVVGRSRTLPAFVTNTGTTDFGIPSYALANSIDFSVAGRSAFTLTPGTTERYDVTFSPAVKTGLAHVGYLTINFDDGQPSKTVVLIGYDHEPIVGTVKIGRKYWALPNENVTVAQELTTSVAGAADSVRHFTETVSYDPRLLDLISVERGELLSTDWALASATLSLGSVQIVANSTGAALTGPGELLLFTFHVHADAPFWATSEFPQTNLVFGTGGEPIMSAEPGLLRIRSECTPTYVESGANGSGIIHHSAEAVGNEIRYAIGGDASASVRLQVYNELGDLVRVLVSDVESPGGHSARLDRATMPSGIYTFVLESDGIIRDIKRLILTR